ncbi:MAG: DUF996 domain-containing protein [Candidatus Verstraetearchaeota archaeon]|nr:DUF996 domain-containing protein [Candidatus Verstraetearchaeota archaeon]
MSIESNKILGGVGAILLFIGVIPFRFMGIISLVGLILILVALYGFANMYEDRRIFNNFLYGIIAGIIGAAIAVAVAIFSVLTVLTQLLYEIFPGWNGDWTALQGMTPDTSNLEMGTIFSLLGGLLLVVAILYAFAIVGGFFARRSFSALAEKTGTGLFSTAGLIFFIGTFLTIILIGFLLIWISILLVAIAFFQIRTQPEAPAAAVVAVPSAPAQG